MKRKIFFIALLLLPIMAWAQERVLQTSIDSTYEACLLARRSLLGKTASKEEMKEASQLYAQTFQLFNIPIIDRSYTNLVPIEGHIVYLPSFFDSLSDGKRIHEFAKRYRETDSERRGVAENRKVKVSNRAIKKKESVVFQYQPKGKVVDFAVVTEPQRLMTVFIEAFDDTGTKIGERIQRRDSAYEGYEDCLLKDIAVPEGTAYFKITVQNKSKKDSSLIIIISD